MILNSEYIFITDIGSTTTKGLLIHFNLEKNRYDFIAQADSYTTVEKPYEDVNIGVRNSAKKIEKGSGIRILSENGNFIMPYITTSSAGGGLQMMVCGLTRSDTGKNAEIVATGAGGVVLRTFTINDMLTDFERVQIIRDLSPDIILVAGGYDGGNNSATMRQIQLMILASPRNRFEKNDKIPLIFCGNVAMQKYINSMLNPHFILTCTENIRPDADTYNFEPAKQMIHQVFKDSVMEHAPGYRVLEKLTSSDIRPTPAAVERILKMYADKHKENIIAIDMGGSTTDIYSWIKGHFNRTVSANVGLSYSIANILAAVLESKDFDNLLKIMPEGYSEDDIRNYINNKTLNPSYLPLTDPERFLEQFCAEFGFTLSMAQHLEMNFNNIRNDFFDRMNGVVNIFRSFFAYTTQGMDKISVKTDKYCEEEYIIDKKTKFGLSEIQTIIGSGGVIAYAKSIEEQIFMLNEGLKPHGITKIVIDMPFKVSHMGILSYLEPDAALEMFERECLRTAAIVIAPFGKIRKCKPAVRIRAGSHAEVFTVYGGQVVYSSAGGEFEITSASKGVWIEKDKSTQKISSKVPVLIDCRGRGGYFTGPHLLKTDIREFQFRYGRFVSNIPLNIIELKNLEFGDRDFIMSLPHPGEIMVEPGRDVKAGDVIGMNESANRSYFYIDLNNLGRKITSYTADEIRQRLQVKKGMEVHKGNVIFKGQSIKTERVSFERTWGADPFKEFDSETEFTAERSGIVSEIYYDIGMICFEIIEKNETAVIDAAEFFNTKGSNIKYMLSVKDGDYVKENQIIGYKYSIRNNNLFLKSPIKGKVNEVHPKTGMVTIENKVVPYILRSYVNGKVKAVEDNKNVVVTLKCAVLNGASGFGGQAYGEAIFIDNLAAQKELGGKILIFKDSIDLKILETARTSKASGIIAPSINNRDWAAFCKEELSVAFTGDEDFGFTLVLIKGFGRTRMEDGLSQLLHSYNGRTISINGRTQIRAGVIRPEIVLPEYPGINLDKFKR